MAGALSQFDSCWGYAEEHKATQRYTEGYPELCRGVQRCVEGCAKYAEVHRGVWRCIGSCVEVHRGVH